MSEQGWRMTHDDPDGVAWYDTGEPGFRLVLDPSLDATYREAVLSEEVALLRLRVRRDEPQPAIHCAEGRSLLTSTQQAGGGWLTRRAYEKHLRRCEQCQPVMLACRSLLFFANGEVAV